MTKRKHKPFAFKPFSPKQRKLLNWWREGSPFADCDIMFADGSIRSGKTIACICSFLIWSCTMHSGQTFIVAGKTIGALKKNVVKPMIQILNAWEWVYTYNRSENFFEINGNTYYMYGANTEASQDTLQGLTAAGALADEAALFPRSFIDQMIGRCSVDGSKIFLNCNPESPGHYLYTDFLTQPESKNMYHLHFTMDDNLSLSQQVKEKFKRMFTGVFFKRFILGLWCASDGLVYQEFADNPEEYVIDKAPEIWYAVVGVDFGGTKSATSFTLTGFTAGYKQIITLDEWYCKKRLSPAQLENSFVDFVKRAKSKYKIMEAYCDSAEQTLIQGLIVAAAKSDTAIDVINAIKGQINNRIAFYNSLMAQKRYKIMRHCKHTIEAFSQAVYDDKQPIKDIRLDNGTINIDSLDSQEYSTESVQDDILYLGR